MTDTATPTDRVESLRAYRELLFTRIDAELHGRIEHVPGGEWDGMDVLRRKELETGIAAVLTLAPLPEVSDRSADVRVDRSGARIRARVVCPRCDLPTLVLVDLASELVSAFDGSEIKAKAKIKAVPHTCGQLAIEDVEDDAAAQMRLSDLVGPTEQRLVWRIVPESDDPLDEVELPDDRETWCASEATVELDGGSSLDLVCERAVDHDGEHLATDVPLDSAGQEIAWHYETVPVELGVPEATDDLPDDRDPEQEFRGLDEGSTDG